jgi:uncharacterized protein (TIGR02145 family)
MRKKVILWMPTLILLISAASVNAQVIIGGNGTAEPHAGAGLDLSPLGTDKLGLLLPGVKLTNDAAEFALVTGATDTQKEDATGMLVYNIANVLTGKGLYVWNGTKWQALTPPPSVTDAEGNTYSIGFFGDAGWWMTENLRTKSSLTANSNSGNSNSAYYYYPHAETGILTSHPEYGLLYTWAAANIGTSATESSDAFSGTVSTRQGICPAGWHLPSDYEWSQLTDVISASTDGAYSTTTGTGDTGRKMKSTTPVDGATNGTSNSRTANGFDALLVGDMYSGSSGGYGTYTYFWSSSSGDSSSAWYRHLYYSGTGVLRDYYYKYLMFSVRCKKNDN